MNDAGAEGRAGDERGPSEVSRLGRALALGVGLGIVLLLLARPRSERRPDPPANP
ncbi:MAG: hypothetical protein KatS3mg013_1586 [Actinomycetota bacterium]|nr:MAG: hypothetical protein KatS3mg013_1586 [Actinomycetota bacterium]